MKTNIRLILLACGLLATLAFMLASGEIYQILPLGNPLFTEGLEDFRYTLRIENWGISLSLITALIPWGISVLYYYVIDSVHADRWWHWLILGIAGALITSWIGFKYIAGACDELEPGLASAYSSLNRLMSVWTVVFSFAIYVISSFSIRWWSANCRHTPFPQ